MTGASGVLVVFAGLPGAGKTTVAREAAKRLGMAYLRLDSLEYAFAKSGAVALEAIGPGGYHAAAAVAVDNLLNGMGVVVDAVNPWPEAREIWYEAARLARSRLFGVEVVCSDAALHRARVESRAADPPDFPLPSWDDVLRRGYVPWKEADLVVDTANLSAEQSVAATVEAVRAYLETA